METLEFLNENLELLRDLKTVEEALAAWQGLNLQAVYDEIKDDSSELATELCRIHALLPPPPPPPEPVKPIVSRATIMLEELREKEALEKAKPKVEPAPKVNEEPVFVDNLPGQRHGYTPSQIMAKIQELPFGTLNDLDYRIILFFTERMFDWEKGCFHSQKTISQYCGGKVSQATLSRSLRKLEKLGIITIFNEKIDGNKKRNTYRWNFK